LLKTILPLRIKPEDIHQTVAVRNRTRSFEHLPHVKLTAVAVATQSFQIRLFCAFLRSLPIKGPA